MPSASSAARRLVLILAALGVGLTIVAGRLVWVQGLASDRYVALAATQRERRATLPAQRGAIFDREGRTLAMSTLAQTIYANPRFVTDPATAAAQLAPVLGQPPGELAQKLGSKRGFVYLARKVDDQTASQVEDLGIPGIDAMSEPKRLYPAGQLAAHVLGFVGTDNAGLAGLETYYDRHLAGRPGEMLIERDPQGRSIPSGKSRLIPPSPGDDLVLTIDSDIQYAAEAALAKAVETFKAKGGSVLVMRPDTGEILALANLPTFDPSNFGAASSQDRRNRALIEIYEPGSANKVITAAAALESGVIGTSEVLSVPDSLRMASKTFHDSHPHPVLRLTFPEVIEQSSNIGTIKVAMRLGKERLHEYLQRFGYGAATGIAFPGESPGLLTTPDKWWSTQLGTAAIGQSVAVTPLQIMSVYATVANGGVWVQPSLASGMIGSGGKVHSAPAPSTRRVIQEETAKTVAGMLVRVVEGEHGTGDRAAIPGYQVAGKTGTAQKPILGGRGYSGYIGSFIGFAPAGDPKLVVGVILDEPRPIWGGVTAAPAFKEVMQFSLRHLGIGPGPVLSPGGAPLPAPGRSGGAVPYAPGEPAAPDATE